MKKYFKRLLASIGRMLARLFNVGIPLKVVLILVLLVPYIVHYFHLENGVQKMYTLIDELEKRKEQ